MTQGDEETRQRGGGTLIILLQRLILWLSRYWYAVAMALAWLFLLMAILAPALMAAGLTDGGQVAYRFLAPHNHQLPQRSYFLFGEAGSIQSYSVAELLAQGADADNMQAFAGNPTIGYKMGLNHRMTAIFLGIVVGGIIWGATGGRPQLGPFWFMVLLLPLLIDGFSHIISENSGEGFRAANAWAVALSGNAFSVEFYQGSTIGSLNWLLRTLTGLLFGLGLVWFLFTYLSIRFVAIRLKLEARGKK